MCVEVCVGMCVGTVRGVCVGIRGKGGRAGVHVVKGYCSDYIATHEEATQ